MNILNLLIRLEDMGVLFLCRRGTEAVFSAGGETPEEAERNGDRAARLICRYRPLLLARLATAAQQGEELTMFANGE